LIIVLAPEDDVIVRQSRAQSYNFPEIFGETYIAGRDAIPQAGPRETVFFIGHGTERGRSGNAEIGARGGAFGFDGLELWQSFREIFPDLYAGNVFIDACESADFADDMFSLIEVFRSQSDLTLQDTSVFGRAGGPEGPMPPPGDDAWRVA
jgi:hypothetical protein